MKPEPLQQVGLIWYVVFGVPIGVLFYVSAIGMLPALALLIAIFLALFWLFSLGFALFTVWRRRRATR